jgi:hypothetical protein
MQIAAVSAVLLLISTFLNWQSVDLPEPFGSVGQSAWHGFWGVVLGLLTIAFIAWLAVQLFAVQLPELPVPRAQITLGLGILILVFALLKNLIDDYSSWIAYVGVVLAAGCAVGAWLMYQEPETATAPSTYTPPPSEPTPPPAQSPPADTPPSETL